MLLWKALIMFNTSSFGNTETIVLVLHMAAWLWLKIKTCKGLPYIWLFSIKWEKLIKVLFCVGIPLRLICKWSLNDWLTFLHSFDSLFVKLYYIVTYLNKLCWNVLVKLLKECLPEGLVTGFTHKVINSITLEWIHI